MSESDVRFYATTTDEKTPVYGYTAPPEGQNKNGVKYNGEPLDIIHFEDDDYFDKDALNHNFLEIEKLFRNDGKELFNKTKTTIINTIYPIGSIYITATDANPSNFLGGTWTSIAQGQCLFGVNTENGTDAAPTIQPSTIVPRTKAEHKENAGHATHQLTIAELPSHSHHTVAKQQDLPLLNAEGGTGVKLPDHYHSAAEGLDKDGKTVRKRKYMLSAAQNTIDPTAYGNQVEIYVNPAAYKKDSTCMVPAFKKLDSNNKEITIGVKKSDTVNEYAASLHTGKLWSTPTISGKVSIPNTLSTDTTGDNQEFSLLPPYLGVYFWQRIA